MDTENPIFNTSFHEIIGNPLAENHRNFNDILIECSDLRWKKMQDYGLIKDKFGNLGIMVRLSDKFARLENMYNKDGEVEDEKIEDTLKDIINYSAMLIARLREEKQ